MDSQMDPQIAQLYSDIISTYTWSQTDDTVQVQIPVLMLKCDDPKSTDLMVELNTNHLIVGVKGHTPIIDGELEYTVNIPAKDGSIAWTFENGEKDLTVTMQKEVKGISWTRLLKIDSVPEETQPSTSKKQDIDDIDVNKLANALLNIYYDKKQPSTSAGAHGIDPNKLAADIARGLGQEDRSRQGTADEPKEEFIGNSREEIMAYLLNKYPNIDFAKCVFS